MSQQVEGGGAGQSVGNSAAALGEVGAEGDGGARFAAPGQEVGRHSATTGDPQEPVRKLGVEHTPGGGCRLNGEEDCTLSAGTAGAHCRRALSLEPTGVDGNGSG